MKQAASPNREICRMLAVIGGILALLILGGWLWHWQHNGQVIMESGARDAHAVGRDFTNFWQIGQIAREPDPGRYYALQPFNDRLRAFLGESDYLVQSLSYPPSWFLPLMPLGMLPYGVALLLFWIGGIATLLFTLRKLGWPRESLLLLMLSPAALASLIAGQPTFFLAAAFIGGWSQMDKRPWLAGLLFGLLSLKPHFALLLPLMLLASQRWKVLATAIVITLAIAALTTAVYGVQVWQQAIELGGPIQHHIIAEPSKNVRAWMVTLYMDLRTAGLSYSLAMLGQLLGATGAAIMVVWCFAKRRDASWSLLLFTSACLLASPYVMGYDTLVFTVALLALLRTTARPTRSWVVALLYFLPLVHFIAVAFEIPGTALLPLIAVIVSYKKLKAA